MPEPTINDFLDLIRPPLDDAIEQLQRDIRAIENQLAARGQTGATIRRVLDVGKVSFNETVLRSLGETRRVASITKLDQKELRQLTIQTLTDFLNRTKSVIDPIKRHAGSAEGATRLIDQELHALDQSLQLKIRQMDTGLLDTGDDRRPHGGGPFTNAGVDLGTVRDPVSARIDLGHIVDDIGDDASKAAHPVATRIAAEGQARLAATERPPAGAAAPIMPTETGVNINAPTAQIRVSSIAPEVSAGRDARIAPPPVARTPVGKSVLLNQLPITLAAEALLILIDARLQELRETRNNQQIAEYEGLKQRVEEFLAAASAFVANTLEEPEVVKKHTSFTEGVRNFWDQRHLQLGDVGLLGVATLICSLADPLAVVVAGVVVGGNKMVDAIKAAAELAKKSDNK